MRLIALGAPFASDDGAALRVAEHFVGRPGLDVRLAGRPGVGLLDLLDGEAFTVLVDVVRGVPPGEVVTCALGALPDHALVGATPSSHALGAAQALALGRALGRALPPGRFVGIGGARFGPGDGLSPEIEDALPTLEAALEAALQAAPPP